MSEVGQAEWTKTPGAAFHLVHDPVERNELRRRSSSARSATVKLRDSTFTVLRCKRR